MNRSEYDELALKAIHEWKNPEIGWFGYAMTTLTWPLSKAGDVILATPGIGDVIKYAISGAVSVCNDIAHWSVARESIYNEFRIAGFDIQKAEDIHKLELEKF